ncbi:hypothetical protein P7C71_g5043, partial [Lecanoromycetidae sp. Uapishka_2]
MAAYEGEERLLTVFADIHYFFSAPSPRPAAHRFDKGSYLYFYANKNGNGGRLEVANNVGTPEQDAFTGSMDTTTVRQSHKHPTLCTITVDGYGSERAGTSSSIQQPKHHWRLPNTDPRDEGKYLFRLHTLDIYFWTAEDANKFTEAVEGKLEPEQVEILDRPVPPAAHEDVMSPVVQNLENVAIKDPAYRNGQTRNSRAPSVGAAADNGANVTKESGQETPRAQDPAAYQPLAYNPAAPAAPEPIRHREKTPPPMDGEAGTGLAGAAYRDHTQSASPQHSLSRPPYGQAQTSQGYMSPQPGPAGLSHASSYASPPPSVGFSAPSSAVPGPRTSSVSSYAPPPPRGGESTTSPYSPAPAFAPPPHNRQSTTSPSSQQLVNTFSPPPQPPQEHAPFYSPNGDPQESPATEILGDSYVAAHRQPLQHLQPQYAHYTPPPQTQGHASGEPEPLGGYSGYQYDQQQPHHHHHQHAQSNEYDIHSQVYRPTLEEAQKHKPSKSSKPAGSPAGRLEENAGKVDKSVNRFFKKLEKRIG